MKLFAAQLMFLALTTLTLSACGPSEPGVTQPVEATATPPIALTGPAASPTPSSAGATTPTSLPGMPTSLCAQPPNVINFEVWQDFMPGPLSGNPLHAALTVELLCPDGVTAADIGGSISIKRVSGSEIITAPVQLDSMADTATSGVKQLSLSMQPGPPSDTLSEGELLTGTASLTIGKDQVEVQLPETAVLFTR